jgi:hypothetical protein
VQGQLDRTWADWFDGMVVESIRRPEGETQTIITGPVTDQAALRGLLNKLWDLNLTLLSVHCIEVSGEEKCEND